MARTTRTGAVSESGIVFFKAGGHNHDGNNSSLIDTKKYSIFDFSVGYQQGSQDRVNNQGRNEQSFREYVIRLVNQSILEPIGISLQDNSITSRHIIANSISAREISANTITSAEIATDTITANNFSNTLTLDAKIIKSNNYIPGTSGWVINGNGFAEFRNITIGGSSNINGLPIGNITTVVTNFETNNDQIATVPSDANSVSFGSAIKNKDASIDLPVSWIYNQGSSSSNSFNIDGFVLYLRSSDSNNNANITISDINNSNVQAVYLTAEKRSHVFSGVPESTSYKAAIRAYRIVDSNIDSNGILYSGFINSNLRNIGVPTIGGGTGISIGDGKIFIGAGNYSNNDTGFYVDSTGSMSLKTSFIWDGTSLTIGNTATVGNQFVSNISNATYNFDRNNDRNATTPTAPTVAIDGSALTQIRNPDSSADITFNWSYTTSDAIGNAANIDGFIVYVRSSPTDTNAYTFGTGGVETPYYLPRDRRSFLLPGVPADSYYTFGVVAYRIVSSDINSQGIIFSSIVKSTAAGENPLRPFSTVEFSGNVTGTIDGTSASTVVAYANAGNTAATNFNSNNDRNATTPTSPVVASNGTAIDHILNTDSSADISFEWTYTTSDVYNAANNIDGFVVYVRSSTSSSTYSFGTTPVDETTYYLPRDKRAFVLPAVAADRYYNFGVAAYRVVDTDVNAAGIVLSPIIQSTGSGENPYRPSSTVAFAGDITGTVANVAASTVVSYATAGNTAATNFNANNDRNSTTPTNPTIASDGTAIDHVINTDGSADISFEWAYTVSNTFNVANNIDGFVIYVRSSASAGAYTFGSTPVDETTYFVPRDKRAFILPAVAADRYYNFAVAAYRIVDTDVNAAGIILSSIIQSTGSGENPYRPSATVAFAGNITGTIDGVSAATVVSYATAGNSAATNFNANNDRNATTPTSPIIASNGTAIDHVINTDSSADISFEWSYTTSDVFNAANNIDGFIVYVRSSTSASSYTFGTTPVDETTYYLPREKRAFVLPAVAANRYYNFGVAAYRVVDTDVSASGIVVSPIIQSTGSGENPYRPSATVAFGGDITGTISNVAASTIVSYATAGNTAATNFNANNDRNATTPTSPVVASNGSAIDHVLNTDSSADISFEWTYTVSDTFNAANNIDGFIVYVRSSTNASTYTFGSAPVDETTYYLPRDKRAFVLPAVAADRYYNFGVAAYRIVDTDVVAAGIVISPIIQSTGAGENPYRPSATVAFNGDITGTIANVAASTVVSYATAGNTAATNFNANNDRNATTPTSPTIASDGTAIDHVINTDSSADISFEWSYTTSNTFNVANNIDGFVVYVRSSTSASSYTFGTTPVDETTYYLPRDKRALILPSVASNRYYNFGVAAYRIVDTDVNAAGVIFSPIIQSNGSNENPYLPSSNVAFGGDITGTIDGVSANTVGQAAIDFFSNNDRNSLVPPDPYLLDDITTLDHVINTDGSADISFEWQYTSSDSYDAFNNIDGFIIYVHSSTSDEHYLLGTSPDTETVFYVTPEKRAFILSGVAADRFYTFGVQAYRVVDSDVDSSTMIKSEIAQSTIPSAFQSVVLWLDAGSGIPPYQPTSQVAFDGDITGTIDGVSATTIVAYATAGNTAAVNFNANNDRNGATPTSPTIASDGSAIDHVINTDSSADISFEWAYTLSNVFNAANNIDGFVVYVRSSTSSSAYSFGTTPVDETTYFVPRDKRAFVLSAVAANRYYNFGVAAYRIVDTDINAAGIVLSPIVQSTGSGENPYRPSSTVAFAGDITGTINAVSANTVATATLNFNSNNDRKNTAPAAANTIVFGSAIPNYNSSLDLPVSWTFNAASSSADQFDIDGFVLYLKTGTAESNTVANITNTTFNNSSVQAFFVSANKRDHIFSGIEPSVAYKAAIRAYRIVDSDIASAYTGDKEGSMIFGPLLNSATKNWQAPVLGGSNGITIGNGKIFIGTGVYSNNNTGFYVDSAGNMSLKSKFIWDNANSTLTVNGVINADSGVFKGSLDIGGPDNDSLQVNTDGFLWIGHRTYATAPFKVTPTGELSIGTSPDWLRVDAGGNVWVGADTFTNAKFRIQDTGDVRVGNGSTKLFIANDGGITIGTAAGTGDFIVQSNGQVDIGGNDTTSLHIAPSGNLWVGSNSTSFSSAKFRIQNTGDIRVGDAATSLFISNNGSITIGTAAGTGDFIVQSNGQVDVGGSDATSLHISPSGNLWVGANSTSFSAAPLKITNDGSIDIGTADSTSLHIAASGNVHLGSNKANFTTAPFSIIASNGDTKANNITLSGTILGTATHLDKSNVVNMIGNIAIGSSKIFATAGANYSNGQNYTLSAADGFLARLDTLEVVSITAAGYNSILNIKTTANTYSGEFVRSNAGNALTGTSSGVQARWLDATEGKLLGEFVSSSKRYKKEIKDLSLDELDPQKLLKLRVVQFKYKKSHLSISDQRYNQIVPGFIAEEVNNIYPIACDLNANGKPETWNVSFVVPPMLKLIQDLYQRVEELERKMEQCKCS